MDENELISAFGENRDEATFRELYRRITPTIFALAVRLTGSRAEAEELTQEAWVRAVERFDNFNHRSAFRTWVTGIMLNCYREFARQRMKTVQQSADAEGASATVIEAFPAVSQMPADPIDIERALANLSEGYREVVILHDVHGYTHAEIASILGVQEGTSKSQLTRGRAHLRTLLNATHSSSRDQNGSGAS